MIRSRFWRALATALLCLAVGACTPQEPNMVQRQHSDDAYTALNAAQTPSGLDTLAKLPVKGRAPMTGYSRNQFGATWFDEDHNGCDTRDDILRRDLTNVVLKSGVISCPKMAVASGDLHDPYTGKTIHFVRGPASSGAVQIDHVVSLGDAWQTGAQQLAGAQRRAFANDPLNLLAVDGPSNEAKGDSDAASWLPPNTVVRCAYISRQLAVKQLYKLWVTQPEHDAMAKILNTCH
jgi:hypothetical protein